MCAQLHQRAIFTNPQASLNLRANACSCSLKNHSDVFVMLLLPAEGGQCYDQKFSAVFVETDVVNLLSA
jgi:hypothetical protein